MAKRNNKRVTKRHQIDLRGDSFFETSVNTLNFITGSFSTGSQLLGTVAVNGVELSGTYLMPTVVSKEIEDAAKAPGFNSFWDSVKSVDAVEAGGQYVYDLKSDFIKGKPAKKKSIADFKHMAKLIKSAGIVKADVKLLDKGISIIMKEANVKLEAISSSIKVNGLSRALVIFGVMSPKFIEFMKDHKDDFAMTI